MKEKLISISITVLHSHYCYHKPVFQSHWQILVRGRIFMVLEMKPVGRGWLRDG